jgi:hypothetical protein
MVVQLITLSTLTTLTTVELHEVMLWLGCDKNEMGSSFSQWDLMNLRT